MCTQAGFNLIQSTQQLKSQTRQQGMPFKTHNIGCICRDVARVYFADEHDVTRKLPEKSRNLNLLVKTFFVFSSNVVSSNPKKLKSAWKFKDGDRL